MYTIYILVITWQSIDWIWSHLFQTVGCGCTYWKLSLLYMDEAISLSPSSESPCCGCEIDNSSSHSGLQYDGPLFIMLNRWSFSIELADYADRRVHKNWTYKVKNSETSDLENLVVKRQYHAAKAYSPQLLGRLYTQWSHHDPTFQ